MERLRLTQPATIVDDLHARLDAWLADGVLCPPLGEESAAVFRLAVHEWVANLVQHATFSAPFEVVVEVAVEAGGVRCAIEDTSDGFDFAAHVEQQTDVLAGPAPSERGRGLLMIVSCAEDLAFRAAAPGVAQRIAFRISPPSEGGVFAPLFRPEDLASGDGAAGWALPGDGAPDGAPERLVADAPAPHGLSGSRMPPSASTAPSR